MNVYALLIHTPYEGSTLHSIHLDPAAAEDAADALGFEELWEDQWVTVRKMPVGMSAEQAGAFETVYERSGPTREEVDAAVALEVEEDLRDQIRDNKVRKKVTEVKYSADWKRLGNYRAERQALVRDFHRASRRQAKQELAAYLG